MAYDPPKDPSYKPQSEAPKRTAPDPMTHVSKYVAQGQPWVGSDYAKGVAEEAKRGCLDCKHSIETDRLEWFDKCIGRKQFGFRLGCQHPSVVFKAQPVPVKDARAAGVCGPTAKLFEANE